MHDYGKFIRPSELARFARATELELMNLTGMTYNLFDKSYSLVNDVSVNYLAYFTKPYDKDNDEKSPTSFATFPFCQLVR